MCYQNLNARSFSIPEYVVNPGGEVDVPVVLDDASGLGVVSFQVNFDASVLRLVSVSQGPLGQDFSEFLQDNEEGVIRVSLVNETNLDSGEGPLVIMRFQMIEGADTTVEGNVSLASYDYTDTSGVVAMGDAELTNVVSGKVQASNDQQIDNYGNRLPDWWEELYGLDKFSLLTADSDPDGDGASALLEYAFNGAPDRPDSSSLMNLNSNAVSGSVIQLNLQLRDNDSLLSYSLETSDNLSEWNEYYIIWNGTGWTLDNPEGLSVGFSDYVGGGIWNVQIEQSPADGSSKFYRAGAIK